MEKLAWICVAILLVANMVIVGVQENQNEAMLRLIGANTDLISLVQDRSLENRILISKLIELETARYGAEAGYDKD